MLRLLTITKNELNHDLDSQDNRQSKIAYVLVKNKNDDEELAKIRQVIRQQEEEIEVKIHIFFIIYCMYVWFRI